MSAGFMIPAANVKRSVAMKARRNGKKARRRPEDDLQRTVCQYLDILMQQGRILYFAVPNGGKRSIVEAARMKRMGTKPGVPDLILIPKVGPVCAIELKSADGTLSLAQKQWTRTLPDFGCPVAVCRSLEEVRQFLFETGVIREVA
jgi:hypothetical protein